MSKATLLEELRKLAKLHDREAAHADADAALLAYIGDKDIADAYAAIPKWYA